jgi:predicted nuclease of predicted toxin-antitoxin system
MRFLIDASLSPRLAEAPTDAGHDAVHVQIAVGLDATADAVFDHARVDQRVIVTAAPDFGDLLAHRATTEPSVILLRRRTGRRPSQQAELLLGHLDSFQPDLDGGAIVVIEQARIRVRALPLHSPG